MSQKNSRLRGAKEHPLANPSSTRTITLTYERSFTNFYTVLQSEIPRHHSTVKICVRVMSRLLDWYLQPGWHDSVKGVRVSRGIVGHLEDRDTGGKVWVADIKESVELRALNILIHMGLIDRFIECPVKSNGLRGPRVRFIRLHSDIMNIVRLKLPPPKSFDAARAELEILKQKAKTPGGIV